MGRKKVVTEDRLREDVNMLKQNADESGICPDVAPSRILQEHWGYRAPAPVYKDIKILEERGRLRPHPEPRLAYYGGYQVDPLTPEALEKRMAYVKDQINTEVAGLIEDLHGIITDLGRLATAQANQESP